ncbi:MAG TPA: APC family permease, partial [Ktedonobacteraceae bacterium]|nr:APC family permease [Ktedonobacteraceae bacterium]
MNKDTVSDSSSAPINVVDNDDPALLIRTEERQGSLPGNVRVRLIRPSHSSFRRISSGVLEAKPQADIPEGGLPRFLYHAKRVLIGAPIANIQAEHERLTKVKALAVLSSDVISSVAYATEAILATLIVAGSGNLGLTLPIAIAIVCLLAIVALSYRQTIPAYPNGGGSYIVAKDNLGTLAGLVAAGSLMIDYILTVSVSVSAGVQALVTLFPALSSTFTIVSIDVALVLLIMLVNLRGVRESGSIFAVPTYIFIASAILLIVVGCFKSFVFQHNPLIGSFRYAQTTEPLSLFLILRSFAAGCSALTGTEAISNGIPAFKKPEARNAATTLTWMVVILGTLFIGTTVLAMSYHIEAIPSGNPTVIGQMALLVFTGPLFFMFPVFQLATLLILTLAANTSYADFPRLSSLLARDHFLPHQFAFRGDRLAFSIGIVSLAILSSLLLVVFRGDTTSLINLYAVGVFMSFTLSQGGMVRHWWRLRREKKNWQRSLAINALGALTTLVVALVIAFTKFLSGAWIVVILIPLLVIMFLGIHRHYMHVERERTTDIPIHPKDIHHRLIVPISDLSQVSRESLAYARSISSQVTAVHVLLHGGSADELRAAWDSMQDGWTDDECIHLEILQPAGRFRESAMIAYIESEHKRYPADTLTVVLPETYAPWWQRLLWNPFVFRLKVRLYFHPNIIVTNFTEMQRDTPSGMPTRPQKIRHRFIVPIAGLDRVSKQSLAYARSITSHVTASHVAIDVHDADIVQEAWMNLQKNAPKDEESQMVIIESPYRSLSGP